MIKMLPLRKCILFVFFALIGKCFGAIYHLNVSEYRMMPPLFALDEYDTCMSEKGASYCLLRLDLTGSQDNYLMNVIKEYSAVTTKHYNHSYLERGVCVQKTCQNHLGNNLESTLQECMNQSIYRQYGIEANVSEIYYCNRHDEVPIYDTWDVLVAVIFGGIVAINVFGTWYDYAVNEHMGSGTGNQILLSFSIKRNWDWLVSAVPTDEKLERLKGFHGVRSFANICTILEHVMFIMAGKFIDKPQVVEEAYEGDWYQVLFNGTMIVQVFFVMSGFLLVYNFKLRMGDKPLSWSIVPKIMFIRWWRLTPALAVTIAFICTWFRHLSSGPLWNLFINNSIVADCRKYWWHHLVYIQNYIPDDKACLIQTWHISADTQLFFVGLVAYIATQNRGRYLMLSILLGLGIIFPALHVYFLDLDGVLIMAPEFFRTLLNDTFRNLHVLGHNNLACFAIGMFLGEMIFKLQQKKVDFSSNKLMSLAIWFVIPSIVLLMYSGHIFYADGPRASLAARMTFAALHRFIMGLLIAFGFTGMILKSPNLLCRIYEWRGWVVPSRLSYAIYLIHFDLLFLFNSVRGELATVSSFYLISCHVSFVLISMVLALPFFLMVEAPMNRLLKTITSSEKLKLFDSNTEIEDAAKKVQ